MLKQGVKTTNADVIQTRALSQLSFIKFTPYANSKLIPRASSLFDVNVEK